MYYDNKFAIYLAHNPSFHERTKHIKIDCHMIREPIQNGLIHLLPVPSAAQLADVFTKPFGLYIIYWFHLQAWPLECPKSSLRASIT